METCWLSIPYFILAVLAGARFYLLSALPTQLAGRICVEEHLSKHQNINWYKWYLRALKDLVVTGILTLLACTWLSGLIPWLNLVILTVLAVLLLIKSAVLLVLWLVCAGCSVPGWLRGFRPHGGCCPDRLGLYWGLVHAVSKFSLAYLGLCFFAQGVLPKKKRGGRILC